MAPAPSPVSISQPQAPRCSIRESISSASWQRATPHSVSQLQLFPPRLSPPEKLFHCGRCREHSRRTCWHGRRTPQRRGPRKLVLCSALAPGTPRNCAYQCTYTSRYTHRHVCSRAGMPGGPGPLTSRSCSRLAPGRRESWRWRILGWRSCSSHRRRQSSTRLRFCRVPRSSRSG